MEQTTYNGVCVLYSFGSGRSVTVSSLSLDDETDNVRVRGYLGRKIPWEGTVLLPPSFILEVKELKTKLPSHPTFVYRPESSVYKSSLRGSKELKLFPSLSTMERLN